MRRRPRFAPTVTRLEDRITPIAGAFDKSFGVNGTVALPQLKAVVDIAPLPDGGAIVLGTVARGTGDRTDPTTDFGVVKLTAAGVVDATFADGGLATVGFNIQPDGRGPDYPNKVAIRPDGKIVVAGTALLVAGTGFGEDTPRVAVALLTPNGSLDTLFNGEGKISFVYGDGTYVGEFPPSAVDSMVILPDNSIVVAADYQQSIPGGIFGDRVGVFIGAARLTTAGTLDPSYGIGGKAALLARRQNSFLSDNTQGDGQRLPTAVGPDGSVVGLFADGRGGSQFTPVYGVRLTPAGVPDAAYGSGGKAAFGDTGVDDDESGQLIRVTADGTVYQLTTTLSESPGTVAATTITRYRPDGSKDQSYATAGTFTQSSQSGETPFLRPTDAVALADGRLLVAGRPSSFISTQLTQLARFTAAGVPDASFDGDGFLPQSGGINAPPLVYPRQTGLVRLGSAGQLFTSIPFTTSVARLSADNSSLSGSLARLVGVPRFAVGVGASVAVYGPDRSAVGTFTPFPGFTGTLRTAAADVSGDGTPDTVAGTGPGAASRVSLIDGVSGKETFGFAPFEASFIGGVYVAAGDIDGDGVADLIVTPDEGGGPRIDIYNGAGGAKFASFFGIDDPNFRGGARAATGDVNADGVADLIVSAGFGGGPRIAIFDGKSLARGERVKLANDFFAFEDALRNGAFVAAGDLNADGFADPVFGGGPGGGPRVTALNGKALLAGRQEPLTNFFGGDTSSRGGIRVSVKDLDGDANADVVVGAGTGAGGRVTAYLGSKLSAGDTIAAFDFDTGSTDGVFVG